ncbi:porin family protein [Shewanella halotolerans]|uniref:porin family protein n=1 Tax=Shewanella halotolerans TaxID=2864204 RepID=UPI001C6561AB|nr:porin family protein [Shewanella halotolerans]QYJ89747.1 porin family protein [Shewanella halotolerans]
MQKLQFRTIKMTSGKAAMLKAVPLALALSFGNLAYADAEPAQTIQTMETSAAESMLERYGVTDELLKLGLSSLTYGDQQVEHVQRSIEIDGEKHESEVFLVQSTDNRGNIDLRIKYDQAKLDAEEDVIAKIEAITKIEYRLKDYMDSYDKSSVVINEINPNHVEISFNYSKYGLPQDIAYFRFMQVKLTLIDGKASTMQITNNGKTFEYDDYRVSEYVQEITFDNLVNGKTVVKEKSIQAKGQKGKKPVNYQAKLRPVAFYDDMLGVMVMDQELLTTVSDPRIREEKVDLDRIFPILGDFVRQRGIDVPLPFGFSVAYRNQDMNVGFNSFDIMGLNLDEFFDPESSIGTVNAESYSLRADINILPFWNVFGYIGKVNVDAVVDAHYTGKMKDVFEEKLGVIGGKLACNAVASQGVDLCSPGDVNVPLHLDYDLVGVGTTLSIGYKEFFASVTASYSVTRLEGNDNWGDGILTIQPMLGYQFLDYRAQVFIGAEYQGLKPTMEGNLGYIDALGRDFTYNVGVELNKWAYLVGFNKQIGKNLNFTALYNKGETRSAITLNLGYRF